MNKDTADTIVYKLYDPFTQFDSVKKIWTFLLNKCLHTYYQSWAWKELWLTSLPPDCELSFVVGFRNESPIVAFFLGSNTYIFHRFLKIRKMSLNNTLYPAGDLIWIEYNTILIDPEITISMESLLELLPIKTWDSLEIIRFVPIYQPNLIMNHNTDIKYDISIKKQKSYYVNLNEVRLHDNDYLAMLDECIQEQIRHSLKEYEKLGELQLHVAENVDDALIFLDELIELHQKEWMGLGYQGAFADEDFVKFHRNLISRRFDDGEIQLVKVSAGSFTIGCVYSFIYKGKVFGCLCGFNNIPDIVSKPGLVCHYFAIVHNAMNGLISYDFHAGGEYAYTENLERLSSGYTEMQIMLLRQRNMTYKMDKIIAKTKQMPGRIKKKIRKLLHSL